MAHEPAPIDGLLSWLPALALSPLLLAQGVYVRRVTPRLPEAPGSRSGVAGGGPSLKLLILGDSAAAGVGAASQDEALAGQLAVALAGVGDPQAAGAQRFRCGGARHDLPLLRTLRLLRAEERCRRGRQEFAAAPGELGLELQCGRMPQRSQLIGRQD